jgi:hypothetical protein
MHWRDDSAYRFAMLARTLVGMAPRDARLYAFVGGEVLRAAISSLGTETMGTHQADILQLIRDVLVQQIGEPRWGASRTAAGCTAARWCPLPGCSTALDGGPLGGGLGSRWCGGFLAAAAAATGPCLHRL